MSPYEKVTEAVLNPIPGRGRTKNLLERTPTTIRKLIRESDKLLDEIEELNLQDQYEMDDGLRVRIFHFLLRVGIEPEKIPLHVVIGQNWIFKAQEYLMGVKSEEEYLLEE